MNAKDMEHTWADAGLAAGILSVPVLNLDDLVDTRAKVNAFIPPAEVLAELRRDYQVEVSDLVVDRESGPPVPVRRYLAHSAAAPAPAVLYFHGGGFVCGRLEHAEAWCISTASSTGAAVFSVDYRLAPEHPYPAAVQDGWTVLRWLVAQAEELDVDIDRLVVAGVSAGGALAAATCLRARNDGGPVVALQLLQYPVLDSSLSTGSVHTFVDTPGWDAINAAKSWRHYLGELHGQDNLPSYASPSREPNLAGLPPTYVVTCERDPLRDEGIHFALALLDAGVPVDLHQVAKTFHGFDSFSATSMTAAAEIARQHEAIRRAVS